MVKPASYLRVRYINICCQCGKAWYTYSLKTAQTICQKCHKKEKK